MISQLNRWSNTEKWSQDSAFRALPPIFKLLYLYILDKADLAGFWFPDWEVVRVHVSAEVPELNPSAAALAALFRFWPDRWQLRGFFSWQYPEGPAAKAPNGFGLKAFRTDLRAHTAALNGNPEVLGVAFEGSPRKLVFYSQAYHKKGGALPTPQGELGTPRTDAFELRTARSKTTGRLARGGGGGAGEEGVSGPDLIDTLAGIVVKECFRVAGIPCLDFPVFLEKAVRKAVDAYGEPLVRQAVEAYLEPHQGDKPRTARECVNRLEYWLQVAQARNRAKGCQHAPQDFDRPVDSTYPRGTRERGSKCSTCDAVLVREEYRDVCTHDHGQALRDYVIPDGVSAGNPFADKFRNKRQCRLCGDVVDAPRPSEAA